MFHLKHLMCMCCAKVVPHTSLNRAMPRFIAEDLGIFSQNRTSISLVDLQHSLGKALAALHWYGMPFLLLSQFVR